MHKQEGNPTDPPEVFEQAMTGFCQLGVRLYRRRLWKEIYHCLLKKYGHGWVATGRREGNRGAVVKVEAAYETLWWASENDWFEYPMGSRLLYF